MEVTSSGGLVIRTDRLVEIRRDLAAKLYNGLLQNIPPNAHNDGGMNFNPSWLAEQAVACADALLAELYGDAAVPRVEVKPAVYLPL